MKVKVWYKEDLVEINEELMNEMENKIEKEYVGDYCLYNLSCEWDNGYLSFFPCGPYEC